MITRQEIDKLINYSMDYAYMMDDEEIEKVIVDFSDVLSMRVHYRKRS